MLQTIEKPIEAYLDYLNNLKAYKPNTIKRYELHLLRTQAELRHPLLATKTGSEIERAIMEVAKKRKTKHNGGHQDDGRQHRFRVAIEVSNFFCWAHMEGLIERNPYPRNTFPKPARREAGMLTDEELRIVYYTNRLSLRDHVMITLCYDTGLRRAELCDIQKPHIDYERRLLHVYSSKTDQWDKVPFTELTKQRMLYYESTVTGDSPYFFPSVHGVRMNPNMVNKIFQHAEEVLGFRLHAHRLRHTVGSNMIKHLQQGQVMRHLRHTDPKVTNHYIHVSGKDLRENQDYAFSKTPHIFAPALIPPGYDATRN